MCFARPPGNSQLNFSNNLGYLARFNRLYQVQERDISWWRWRGRWCPACWCGLACLLTGNRASRSSRPTASQSKQKIQFSQDAMSSSAARQEFPCTRILSTRQIQWTPRDKLQSNQRPRQLMEWNTQWELNCIINSSAYYNLAEECILLRWLHCYSIPRADGNESLCLQSDHQEPVRRQNHRQVHRPRSDQVRQRIHRCHHYPMMEAQQSVLTKDSRPQRWQQSEAAWFWVKNRILLTVSVLKYWHDFGIFLWPTLINVLSVMQWTIGC